MDKLQKCISSRYTRAIVERDMEIGASQKANGTPTLFLNGRKLGNYAGLHSAISEEFNSRQTVAPD